MMYCSILILYSISKPMIEVLEMRISRPLVIEHFGDISITSPVKTLSMASSVKTGGEGYRVSMDELIGIAEKTVIVVPVKDEDLFLFRNTLYAIPEWSPVIVVSASPHNIFEKEVEVAKLVNEQTGKHIILVHQRDPAWSTVLTNTRLSSMLDGNGLVRYGKGEGMLLSILFSKWLGAEYIGFVDSDNYIPGSIHEYAMIYYTGFSYLNHKYSMVRIVWSHKGKLTGAYEYGEETGISDAFIKYFISLFGKTISGDKRVVLRRKGRVSQIVEEVLNYALSVARGIGTDIVKTPNSGEHALSTELALNMEWAGGFSVETYELAFLLSECFIGSRDGSPCGFKEGVKILQVESLNPHIHSEKGDEHLAGMLAESLGAIYYSKLNNQLVSKRIREALKMYADNAEPIKPRTYSLKGVNPVKIIEEYIAQSKLLHQFGSRA